MAEKTMYRELTKEESDFLHEIYSDPKMFEEWIAHMEQDYADALPITA